MDDFIDTPKDNNLIYDVGMHKGEDTEYYLRKGFRVIAFEAIPALAEACRVRLKAFVDTGQLIVVEGAIVDTEAIEAGQTKVRFYQNDDVSVWGTVCQNWAERNERLGTSNSVIEVDVVDFSEIIQKYGVPHFIKIDIEGSDIICVETFKKFQHRPDYLSIESDKNSFKNIKYEIDLLSGLGYDNFQAVEQSEIPLYQKCISPAKEGEYLEHQFEGGASGLFGAELADDKWVPKDKILRQYRIILFGYYIIGDDGIVSKWKFWGAWKLQSFIRYILRFFTKAAVPGWYDTHARHSTANFPEK